MKEFRSATEGPMKSKSERPKRTKVKSVSNERHQRTSFPRSLIAECGDDMCTGTHDVPRWSVSAPIRFAVEMRVCTHQITVLCRSEPAVSHRQQSDNNEQQHKTLSRSKAQKGTMTPLSLSLYLFLSLSLSLSDTIVYNGSDKLNQIRCGKIVGMNAC